MPSCWNLYSALFSKCKSHQVMLVKQDVDNIGYFFKLIEMDKNYAVRTMKPKSEIHSLKENLEENREACSLCSLSIACVVV